MASTQFATPKITSVIGQPRAPIVVSELLDSEDASDSGAEQDADEDAQRRDDLEELTHFTSLLMPAARTSAARRMGTSNGSNNGGPIARNARQRMSLTMTSNNGAKFPVIDEDLLMLATRRAGGGQASAPAPPPNLCRLITNVSECRWTSGQQLGQHAQRERPKSVGGYVPTVYRNGGGWPQAEQQQPEVPPPRFVMRNTQQRVAPGDNNNNHGKYNIPKQQYLLSPNDVVALRRLSALSMASSVSSNGAPAAIADDATNCDCTSLALAAIRSSALLGTKRKKWLQHEKNHRRDDADDSYRKVSATPSTAAPDSPANDSGISTASSEFSSRSASLSNESRKLSNNGQPGAVSCCTRCGRKMSLPPRATQKPPGKNGAIVQSRRRRLLNYLLGNWWRIVDNGTEHVTTTTTSCRRCGAAAGGHLVDLKLLPTPPRENNIPIPLINVQIAEEEEDEDDTEEADRAAVSTQPNNKSQEDIAGGIKATNSSAGDKSPRWCGDPNETALVKNNIRQLWERPSGPAAPFLPFTSGPTTRQSQQNGVAAQRHTTKKAAEEPEQSSSVSVLQNGWMKGQPRRASLESPSASSSVITVQHQLINGGSVPQAMVAKSTKVPRAQFISASVSAVISGKCPAATSLIPSGEEILREEERKDAQKGADDRKRPVAEEKPKRDDPEHAHEAEMKRAAHIVGRLAGTPKFHFPLGRPVSQGDNDQILSRIRELFDSRPHAQLHIADFGELCTRMGFAIYAKRPVYDACCHCNGLPILPRLASGSAAPDEEAGNGDDGQKPNVQQQGAPIDFNQFCVYWNRMISEAHDEASRFVFTLSALRHSTQQQQQNQSQQRHILREDFVPMLMDLILTHPGLHFLKEAPQFYSRYADVVIVRIFWNVNRSWSGKISATELRRSNFLQTLHMLDDVQDINKVTDYFSYEHFYVTYCKFWELDTDHDMIISRDDMRRHCNGALPDRIIERVFSAAVIRTPPEQRTVPVPSGPIRAQPIETIGFEDFVCFLLAEEDKRHPTSIEYWFRCVDLDGDGQISLYEMEYFYEAIEQKLLAKNMETLALRDVICNLLDSIAPANGYSVTRADLKRSGLAHRFFNTFVNWIKYVDQESSDGERASVKTNEDKELSDWEMFCLSEYELLMSETEQLSNEGDVDENIDVILDDDEEEPQIALAIGEEKPNRRKTTTATDTQHNHIGNGTVVGDGYPIQQQQQQRQIITNVM